MTRLRGFLTQLGPADGAESHTWRYHGIALNQKQKRITLIEKRIERLSARQLRLQALNDRFVRLRLAVFIIGAAISSVAFLTAGPSLFWIPFVIAVVAFIGVVVFHQRVMTSSRQNATWLQHQRAQVARARLDWSHIPPSTVERPAGEHPFASDLNLLGDRSLHQLLCTATTAEGAERLAAWLTATNPQPEIIAHRQSLVRELIPQAPFRDHLVLYGLSSVDEEAIPWRSAEIIANLTPGPGTKPLQRALIVSGLLAICTVILFLLNLWGVMGSWWSVSWVLYIVIFVLHAGHIRELFSATYEAHTSLNRLSKVFRFLEKWSYTGTPALRELCSPFLAPAHRPSGLLRKLAGILAGASLQQNIFLWLPVNLLVPWDLFFALLLRQSQQELYEKLPAWMDAWHELEALSSLANYAYLNPAASLPVLLEDASPSTPFSTRAIGHPLIPDTTRICNDIALPTIGSLMLLTGSNMSGKSSFLRTLGVNLSMAYAGGPVCAANLETRLFRLYTCIAVSDSVVDGISYFYAEVKRLKRLLDALETKDELPLFFLIDEIFRATNNRERLIGSRSYVRALAGQNGVGIISTHDLELTRLEGEIPQLANYHFREHVQDNRLVFDYLLRPGPSPSTNALHIMRQEGLPVSDT